jgi:hypothetical protein
MYSDSPQRNTYSAKTKHRHNLMTARIFRSLGGNRLLVAFVLIIFAVIIVFTFLQQGMATIELGGKTISSTVGYSLIVLWPFVLTMLIVGAYFSKQIFHTIAIAFLFAIGFLARPQAGQFLGMPISDTTILAFYLIIHILILGWGIFVFARHKGIRQYLSVSSDVPGTREQNAPRRFQDETMNARKAQLWQRNLVIWTVIVVFVLFATYYYTIAWYYHQNNIAQQGLDHFTLVLIFLNIILIPMYMLTGSDHTELGEAVSSRLCGVIAFKKAGDEAKMKVQAWRFRMLVILTLLINILLISYDLFFLNDRTFLVYGVIVIPFLSLLGVPMTRIVSVWGKLTKRPKDPIHKSILIFAALWSIVIILIGMVTHSRKLAAVAAFMPLIISLIGLIMVLSIFIIATVRAIHLLREVGINENEKGRGYLIWLGVAIVFSIVFPFIYRWVKKRYHISELSDDARNRLRWEAWINFLFLVLASGTSVFAFSRVIGKDGLEAFLAPALAFSSLLLLLLRKNWRVERMGLAEAYFKLSFGLFLLTIIYDIISPNGFLGTHFLMIAYNTQLLGQVAKFVGIPSILIIIAALLWDYFSDAELVTSHATHDAPDDAIEVPHPARLLLLSGYTLLSLTALTALADYDPATSTNPFVQFLISLHGSSTTHDNLVTALLNHPFDHVSWILLGITVLGTTSLLIQFVLDVGDWHENVGGWHIHIAGWRKHASHR